MYFDSITNYAITNEAKVKKYLQEDYTGIKRYQKYEQSRTSEGGLSGTVSKYGV